MGAKHISEYAKELTSPEHRHTEEVSESSYRRGYVQAYSRSQDDLKDLLLAGMDLPKAYDLVIEFFNGPLQDWRASENRGYVEPPIFAYWLKDRLGL
jgi:hypothetical protein